MLDILHISVVSIVAFAATNLDNFWLLVALHARGDRATQIAVGFLAATLVVSTAAWAASAGIERIPPQWIDYLGIVPLAMGLMRARDLFRPEVSEAAADLGIARAHAC